MVVTNLLPDNIFLASIHELLRTISRAGFFDRSATYTSRNSVPPGVVSKVILRHQDLKTTHVYLGKISDSETIRWMDVLHGKYGRST